MSATCKQGKGVYTLLNLTLLLLTLLYFRNAMVWTDYHDILLCREMMVKNPFQFKKSSTQRGHVWLEIATTLACIKEPKFKTDLDQRAVRDRYNLLSRKLRKKLSSEKKASGIDTDMSEVEDMIEELIFRLKMIQQNNNG
jgi:hypothetical protein